jgi:hypothetical protein
MVIALLVIILFGLVLYFAIRDDYRKFKKWLVKTLKQTKRGRKILNLKQPGGQPFTEITWWGLIIITVVGSIIIYSIAVGPA